MANVGRPRALDEGKLREIAALVSAGYPLEGAANHVQCSMRTIRRELKRNKEFAEKIRRNQLIAELDPLNSVRNFARTHWRAAAWFMERTYPQRYGKHNPALMKPSAMLELLEEVIEVIAREVPDEQTRMRIADRLLGSNEFLQEAVAAHSLDGKPAGPIRLMRRQSFKNSH